MREDIAKWVEALRSGEYKQGKYALEYNGAFCCLGVYCKIHGLNYNLATINPDTGGVVEINGDVYQKLRRELLDDDIVDHGVEMNDAGYFFEEIADMIEEYYTEEESNA